MKGRSSVTETCSKYLPLTMNTLTPEMIRKAEEELGETPESTKEGLKQLRRLIHEEKDFRPQNDDAFLLRFLRCRKFDVQAAFRTLKNFYTFKARYSRLLTEFLPSEVKHVYDLNMITTIPYRNEEGCLVGVAKLAPFDLDKTSVDELFAAVIVAVESVLKVEATQICGVVIVIDLKGLTLRLVRHAASPTLLYRVVRAIQDSLPVRIKAIHVVHEPFYMGLVYNILKTFLSEKLKSRFQFHGNNLESLHKQVPPAILPKEMGGDLGPINSDNLAKPILDDENHYLRMYKYGYHENKVQFIKKKSSMAFGLYA